MERPHEAPQEVALENLPKTFSQLSFLTELREQVLRAEEQVSVRAGEIVSRLYRALLSHALIPDAPETLRSLNILCVRLVFCLYAEDVGIFPQKNQFRNYLVQFDAKRIRRELHELFAVLDTPQAKRDPYLEDDLAAFPYVNGGLFADADIEIPPFDDDLRSLLLEKASDGFDWSGISPTIFGALFESTLNPDTRHDGGMHYTSIENIHKVIDPLFLNSLRTEFEAILSGGVTHRRKKLTEFQDRLANLRFLDPACGSGNFLTETYLSLRALENGVISALNANQGLLDLGDIDIIRVGIHQFYGIEINDFAATVARTALWIAESQMMQRTSAIVHRELDFLPLKTNPNIVTGNALRMPWHEVIPAENLSYIIGNPPFLGYSLQSPVQKTDMQYVWSDENDKPYRFAGKIDYVSAWYLRAAQLMQGTDIRTAFVSTNSITQGEQVAGIWGTLCSRYGIHIDFAYRTFRWDNEAAQKAHVFCVIVGFSSAPNTETKLIFEGAEEPVAAKNINGYLVNAPDVFVESRKTPLCSVPAMTTGNRPADGGHLIIEAKDYPDFVTKEPGALPFIKRLIGAEEFINGKDRWCLWLKDVSPAVWRKLPLVVQRVEACREDRLNAKDAGRQKLADTPTLFRETNNPISAIVMPAVSSERRAYVPVGYIDGDTIATNLVILLPDATLYHFGVLTSSLHMAWMRAVAGRLEMRYRYSKDIVYNNFPWPEPTEEQRAKIEQTAQAILEARAKYPDCSLADLYDDLAMPPELRAAHRNNDHAVLDAYGLPHKASESALVSALFELYKKLLA